MNLKTLIITAICSALFPSWVLGQVGDDLPMTVPAEDTFEGQIFGFGRAVVVEGVVDADVGAAFADVRIAGIVNGNVSVLRGKVTIAAGATITGDVVCVGGSIDQDPNAQVGGQTIVLLGANAARILGPRLGMRAQVALFFARSLMMFLVVILLFYLFPTQVRQASFDLAHDLRRSTLVGILVLAALALALFVSFLLMVVAIGVPLFILIGCTLTVFAIFGQVVVYVWLSRGFEQISGGKISQVSAIFAAVIAISALSLVPVLGLLIQILVLVWGTGIVILTRFGTNKTWFTKKVRYWSAD